MPRRRILHVTDELFLRENSREFLHIANLSPDAPGETRLVRAEAARILRVAHALTDFARLWSMSRWDEDFLFFGSKVFVRFPLDDLLSDHGDGSLEIVDGIRQFDRWLAAQIKLNEAVRDVSSEEGGQGMTMQEALGTLNEYEKQKAPSGERKQEIFRQWAGDHARVGPYALTAFTVEGLGTETYMPPKMHLRRRPAAGSDQASVPDDPRNDVVAMHKVRIVRGVGGDAFLITPRSGEPSISKGRLFSYPLNARVKVKRWVELK